MPRSMYLAALAGQRFRAPVEEGGDATGGGSDAAEGSQESNADSNDDAEGDAEGDSDSADSADDTSSDDQDTESNEDSEDQDEPEGAPEKYEDFTLPEGFEISEERSELLTEFAKENNWTQEEAQKAVDLFTKVQQEEMQAHMDAWNQRQESWLDEIKADESLSKNIDATTSAIGKALDKFGSDELRSLMDPYDPEKNPEGMGIGNHPELVRFFAKVGNLVGEDDFENPDRRDSGEKPLHERMWNK